MIWVNDAGARFVEEGVTGSVETEAVWAANEPAHVITTAEGVRAAAPADAADSFVGALRCYDDLAALSRAEGIALAGLEATLADVERYRSGEPDPFGRDAAELPDLSGAPCVAVPGRLPQKSFGGLQVDAEGRALNADGEVVPGLWVAGEAAGHGRAGVGRAVRIRRQPHRGGVERLAGRRFHARLVETRRPRGRRRNARPCRRAAAAGR